MAEKKDLEMLSALMGERGTDTIQMLQRMKRLKKLMGTPSEKVPAIRKEETGDIFSRGKNENMISAAIPFLDREYQRGLYVIVRLMEMRRVLSGDLLETRERQEEPPALRRQRMLKALQPYMSEGERSQLETIMKMMTMKEIMGKEEKK